MALVSNTYGKGRVRVMRVERSTDRHEVRELTVKAMVEGDFAPDLYGCGQFQMPVDRYRQERQSTLSRVKIWRSTARNFAQPSHSACSTNIRRFRPAKVEGFETKWVRSSFGGKEHNHTFTLDSNGKPFATVSAAARQADDHRVGH